MTHLEIKQSAQEVALEIRSYTEERQYIWAHARELLALWYTELIACLTALHSRTDQTLFQVSLDRRADYPEAIYAH